MNKLLITHHNVKDLIGVKFSNLIVLERSEKRPKNRQVVWICKCDCGNVIEVRSSNLIREKVRSCGCKMGEFRIKTSKTHGMTNSRQYNIWVGIKTRCYNKLDLNYKNYGGRGIKVCDRWLNSFENFWEDMKDGYKDNLSIDRIDNNGNYEPNNCRWATYREQANNTRHNRLLEINGVKKSMSDWSKYFNIKYRIVMNRIYSGWSEYEALSKPKSKFYNG